MLYTLPLLGALLEHGLRCLLTWAMLAPAQAAGAALPPLDAWLAARAPRAWGAAKSAASRIWWAQRGGPSWPGGRALAPYDPRL